jgi:cytochrome c oxidase cbb3-type subunit 3
MAEYRDDLLDHEYDGIRELDNDLPPWWLYLFYFTIVWAVLYFAYYHVFSIGYSSTDQYMSEIDPRYSREQNPNYQPPGLLKSYYSPWHSPRGDETPYSIALSGPQVEFVELSPEDEPEVAALTTPEALGAGEKIFRKNCVQCHGAAGEGGIGPNLTDPYWLHGAGINNVLKTIKYGVPAKGMISWRGFLDQEQIHEVASYVVTLVGTNPPNAKAPQGELVAE